MNIPHDPLPPFRLSVAGPVYPLATLTPGNWHRWAQEVYSVFALRLPQFVCFYVYR